MKTLTPFSFWQTMSVAVCVYLLMPVVSAFGTQWHVSGSGDDTRDGHTPQTAMRTLQLVADKVEPGDTVLIGDGVYTNADTAENSSVLRLNRSGKPDAWITWQAEPGAHPMIKPIGWNGIFITSSYNIIDGITVLGINDSIVFSQALEDGKIKDRGGKKYPGDPKFNTNGIFVCGRPNTRQNKPHHNIIRHCTVSKMPGGGIVGIENDYLTVEDNIVFDNCWYMRYGGSGITTLNNWALDDAPGYHIIIQRNKVWNNKTNVPWEAIGKLSDGNGILLDVSDQDKHGAANADGAVVLNATTAPTKAPIDERPEWKGRTLVANNVSAFNGGTGVGTFRTKHADLVNNTTYWNGCNVGYAELYASHSDDVVMMNNVIVPRPNGKVTIAVNGKTCRWDYNLYPVAQTVLHGPHDIAADPGFVQIPLTYDLRTGDLSLNSNSPAMGSGIGELAQEKDVTETVRGTAKPPTRGAYAK